jgi:hypothetical protein
MLMPSLLRNHDSEILVQSTAAVSTLTCFNNAQSTSIITAVNDDSPCLLRPPMRSCLLAFFAAGLGSSSSSPEAVLCPVDGKADQCQQEE